MRFAFDDGATVNVDPFPPFEPGDGDDESMYHATYVWWPEIWAMPVPNAVFHPIESEAVNEGDDHAQDEHKDARSDSGNPGKNHQTID